MKYLKTYKLFESNKPTGLDINDVFEPYINWNLIDDAKDMSLEYLDEDMVLFLDIIYDDKYEIYYMSFSSYVNFSRWRRSYLTEDSLYKLKPIDKSKLIYQFYLTNKYGLYDISASKELVSRIKEAYPNENVDIYKRIKKQF